MAEGEFVTSIGTWKINEAIQWDWVQTFGFENNSRRNVASGDGRRREVDSSRCLGGLWEVSSSRSFVAPRAIGWIEGATAA
jgi:hypothetical protein